MRYPRETMERQRAEGHADTVEGRQPWATGQRGPEAASKAPDSKTFLLLQRMANAHA